METITATWTENQDITFDDPTPAKTVEGKGSVDLAALGYIAVLVQVLIEFGNAADGNANVRLYGSADSGITKDTILLNSFDVAYTVSTTKVISFVIRDVPWLQIGIYNGNSAAQDITISAKFAGLKYTLMD